MTSIEADTWTYWHIAHEGYRTGEELVCRDILVAEGWEQDWKWTDAPVGFDGDVVSLFPDTPRGRTEADWMWSDWPEFVLLRVDVPDREVDRVLGENEEGYPVIAKQVPGAWITEVCRGYDAGVLLQPGDDYDA